MKYFKESYRTTVCSAVIALVEAVWLHENDRRETSDRTIGPKVGPTAYTCTKGNPLHLTQYVPASRETLII